MTDLLEPIRRALQGRYHVERLLGEGGMAIVYLARDERHHRRVAVKILRPELAQSVGVERFGREIEIAARLNHPHILPLLDSGALELGPGWPAAAYYVMPYIEGESLRDRLARDGRLPIGEALRLTREIADALDHAHRHGVVHRDIKPENVLLSENHAVVADFGIARALDEAAGAISRTGQAIGTPAYMSPEQITGERTVDGRTDIYALACTLYEMLAGKAPWGGLTVSAALAKRLAGPAPRIRTLDPSVPAAVDEALARALALEPENRFATSAEFGAALALSAGTPPAGGRTTRRLAVRAAAVVGVVLALGFGLIRLARPGHADAITALAIAPEPGDSATAYLSEGVLDAVANLLRRIPQLRLTAPSLVAQLRRQQPEMTAEELGQRLKVGAILTWSLRHTGDSLHLSAELVRVPGGTLLWNARFGRSFAEVASIQGEVARMVADSLRLQLTGSEIASMGRRPTASAAAYDLYLRGRRFSLRGVPLGAKDAHLLMDSAAYYGRAAIALDSSFAQAYGLLGTYYFVVAFRGWGPFQAYVDSTIRSEVRALASDSTLGDPWVNMISTAIYLDDDWPAAQEAATRALRLSSHDAQVLQFAGIVIGEVEGRVDSAIRLLRRAEELEPSIPNLNTLGDLYMRAGRFDSAVGLLRSALELDPSVPGPRRRLIQSLERLKRFDDAIAARRQGGDTAAALAYARGFAEGGEAGYERVRRQDLERQLGPLLPPISRPYKLPDDTVPQLREERIVALYAQLGQWNQAMDWVLKLRERRPRRFRLIVTNPLYDGLRSDPRFLPLVKAEGLEGLLPRRP
jgi:TolB-like protein